MPSPGAFARNARIPTFQSKRSACGHTRSQLLFALSATPPLGLFRVKRDTLADSHRPDQSLLPLLLRGRTLVSPAGMLYPGRFSFPHATAGGMAAVLVAAAVFCWIKRTVEWGGRGSGGGWKLLGSVASSDDKELSSNENTRISKQTGKNATGVPASEWENLSDEERRAWRQLRESEKLASKEKLERAMNSSSATEWKGSQLEIVFDLSYGASSTDKMNRSLAKQLAYAYSYAKNISGPEAPGMHITSYLDEAQVALEKRGAASWLVHKHEGNLRQVFQNRLDDLIYLSPDGSETLETLTPGKVYVIGGIVDRTVSKGVSLEESSGRRSGGSPIRAMRLPIDENIPRSFQGRGHVLNINTVAHILMVYSVRRNWEEAIVEVMYAEAPARFRETIQPEKRALVDGSRPAPTIPAPTAPASTVPPPKSSSREAQ